MKALSACMIVLVAAVALAGCAQPPATPPGGPQGTVTSVRVSGAPDSASPNTQATLCWRVEGSGTIPHTALHYGPSSHPAANASFGDYPSAAYPGNQTAAASAGYSVPGSFCTNIPVGSGAVYFRAHAMQAAPGQLTEERRINASSTPTAIATVSLGEAPASAGAGSNVTLCWSVTGTGTIPHTALHTDTVSHQTSASFAEYQGNASYPANRTSADPVGYRLPGNWCSNVKMPLNGTLYVRAHAMQNAPGILSPQERAIAVNNTTQAPGLAATVGFVGDIPATARAGTDVAVCWRVQGTGTIPHTAIHTDDTSHQVEVTATFQAYDGPAYYPNNETAANATGYPIPNTFCTGVRMPAAPGTVYMRAHALDSTGGNGRLNVEERSIQATP